MKPDTKNSEYKRGKNDEVRLRSPLHPDDKKGGKGVKASKDFNKNCDFNVNGKK